MSENPIFSYTKRDYETSRKEGLAKIPTLSKGVWTDLNATDPGIIILDYVHALVDMINYYQDHQALEVFITTAKERVNIFRIAKQLSYKIRSAKGATCEVTFTSSLLYDHSIKIKKYTAVRSLSGITYLTSEESYLPAHTSRVTVPCSQGVLKTMTYKGTGISRFSNVERAANQSIKLSSKTIDIDSIIITDNTNRLWTPVDYIIFSTEKDRVYQVDLNPDDTITIKFGDGERGIVPSETDELTIQYVETLAEDGKVGAESLIVLVDEIEDRYGNYVPLTVTNQFSSAGGSSAQSSEEIRELAPGVIKSQNRAVTLTDFESLAKQVDGVADAKAYDINTKPDLCLHHEVKVLVTPKDSQGDNTILNKNVYNYLYERMIPPTNLQILTPSYIYIDVDIVVKQLDNMIEGGIEYNIRNAVEEYFQERIGAIGEKFYPSDLTAIISNIPGVRYLISLTPSSIVDISDLSVAKLGNLTVTVK